MSERDARIPDVYPRSVVMLRNNGDTVSFWLDRGTNAFWHAKLLRQKGYYVNSVIRFKCWK